MRPEIVLFILAATIARAGNFVAIGDGATSVLMLRTILPYERSIARHDAPIGLVNAD